MPVTLSYPGVYIEELPSGVHTITGVATSITAFIGRANRGPVNTSITINSYADYDRTFGGLWAPSTMSFAVNDFFANGGSQAVIVRLATATASTGTITLPQDTASGSPTPSGPPPFSSLILNAANPGAWSDGLSVIVDQKTKSPKDPTLFNLTVTLKDPTLTTILATEKYLNLSVDPTSSRYVAKTLAQNSALVAVQQDASGDDEVPAVRPAATVAVQGSPPQLGPAPVFAQGGGDGDSLSDNDFIGPGTLSNKLGLYALENVDVFNILCIPPYVNDDQDVVQPWSARRRHTAKDGGRSTSSTRAATGPRSRPRSLSSPIPTRIISARGATMQRSTSRASWSPIRCRTTNSTHSYPAGSSPAFSRVPMRNAACGRRRPDRKPVSTAFRN
jgi:Bacteriophage tail sheath protein